MFKKTEFFADHKNWLSLIAIIISVLGVIFTVYNQREQNRRWDALNTGSLEFMEAKMFIWKEITGEEAKSTNWGYKPLILNSRDSWQKYSLLCYLQMRDEKTGMPVPNANVVFTIPEVEDEVKRLHIKFPIVVCKVFRPTFIFENNGKTEINKCKVDIQMLLPNNSWKSMVATQPEIRLPPSQSINTYFDIVWPLNGPMPKEYKFKMQIKFSDINGNIKSYNQGVNWNPVQDYWYYDN
jgi:hypothetical protein